MNNGDSDPLVRILSDDGSFVPDAPEPSVRRPRRWYAPVLIVIGFLAVFFVVTRPDPNATEDEVDPAPLSAVNAELIDLTNANPVPVTGEWEKAVIPARAIVNDMLTTTSLFIAAGTTTEGAQAWTTGTGTGWNPINEVDRPGSVTSGIDHVVLFKDDLIALGTVDGEVSFWTAGLLPHWVYQGPIAAFEGVGIVDVAAGKELLAISAPEGQVSAWLSSDGRRWRSIGRLHDLDGSTITGITATDDWYFAYGFTHGEAPRSDTPVVFRSDDGVEWEARQLPGPGLVIDLVAVDDRLFATGWVEGAAGSRVAVWQSSDSGATWAEVTGAQNALQATSTSLEVASTRTGDYPAAQLTVAGNVVEVTVGSQLQTDVGSITVSEITDSSVSLAIGGHTLVANIAESMELAAYPSPRKIAVEGPRIAVVGHLVAEDWSTPVVWASADEGQTWVQQVLPGSGAAEYFVGSRGSHLIVVGGDGQAWSSTWTDDAASDVAIDIVGRYLDALNSRDSAALTAIIPASMADPEAARFQVPSLGWSHMMWWGDDGELAPELMADTLDYLEATATTMATGEGCTASVTLGPTDRASVSCPFTVESDLLAVFGYAGSEGELKAVVNDGVIERVLLQPAPSAAMWNTHGGRITDGGEAGPVFDATSARTHLDGAEQYVAALLQPGETRTAETPFGPMEWSWLETPPIGSGVVPWVKWTQLGFVAIGYDGDDVNPQVSTWHSPDGTEWVGRDLPDDVEGLWELHDFQSGLVGQIRRNGMAGMVYFDGTSWVDIPTPTPITQEPNYGFIAMAVGEDSILAVAGAWDDAGVVTFGEMLLIDEDFVARPAALPDAAMASPNMTVDIAPTESGFVLMNRQTTPGGPISIWSMNDDADWSLLTDEVDLGDAAYLYGLQRLGSLFFAGGEASSLECSADSDQTGCWYLPSLWSSVDAIGWTRVRTDTGAVVPVNSLGFGPLGFAAVGAEHIQGPQPNEVYLSRDGQEWQTTTDLALLDTRGSWWWFGQPAVGTDTIIITGSTYVESNFEPTEFPIMIVGRLVDG